VYTLQLSVLSRQVVLWYLKNIYAGFEQLAQSKHDVTMAAGSAAHCTSQQPARVHDDAVFNHHTLHRLALLILQTLCFVLSAVYSAQYTKVLCCALCVHQHPQISTSRYMPPNQCRLSSIFHLPCCFVVCR
jgi:hypothetical protein